MRGAYYQYLRQKGTRHTDAVEEAQARRKEEAEIRLARIQNGQEPSMKNGTTLVDAGSTPALRKQVV